MIKNIPQIEVSDALIQKGQETLNSLLPRESATKFADLSLLSLIWPYKITNNSQTKQVLENVQYHLLRKRGVIRYKNDKYYNKNQDGFSEEAEWTFGLSWLSIIYALLHNKKKSEYFLKKAMETVTKKGEIPELYFSNTDQHNKNTPLGWSESLFIVALYKINKKAKN